MTASFTCPQKGNANTDNRLNVLVGSNFTVAACFPRTSDGEACGSSWCPINGEWLYTGQGQGCGYCGTDQCKGCFENNGKTIGCGDGCCAISGAKPVCQRVNWNEPPDNCIRFGALQGGQLVSYSPTVLFFGVYYPNYTSEKTCNPDYAAATTATYQVSRSTFCFTNANVTTAPYQVMRGSLTGGVKSYARQIVTTTLPHIEEPVCQTFVNDSIVNNTTQKASAIQAMQNYCSTGVNMGRQVCTDFFTKYPEDIGPIVSQFMNYCTTGDKIQDATGFCYKTLAEYLIDVKGNATVDSELVAYCIAKGVTVNNFPTQSSSMKDLCSCHFDQTVYEQFTEDLKAKYPKLQSADLGNPRCLLYNCAGSQFKDITTAASPCQGIQCIQIIDYNLTDSTIEGDVFNNQNGFCTNFQNEGDPSVSSSPPTNVADNPNIVKPSTTTTTIIIVIVVASLVVISLMFGGFFLYRFLSKKGIIKPHPPKPPRPPRSPRGQNPPRFQPANAPRPPMQNRSPMGAPPVQNRGAGMPPRRPPGNPPRGLPPKAPAGNQPQRGLPQRGPPRPPRPPTQRPPIRPQ